jgi:hypothetical protein
MTITLAGYEFSGPFSSTSSLEDRGGVYAILTPTSSNQYKVLDVGESATVKTRVENHDRKPCWQRNANTGGVYYAAYYTPGMQDTDRQAIEQKIREKYDPPCGKR